MPRVRPSWVGELLVVLTLLWVYDWVKQIAAKHGGPALGHGLDVVRGEKRVGLFIEPHLNRWITEHSWLSSATSYYYQFEFYTVAFIVLGFCWWSRPHIYRWARNALVLTNVVGLVVFVIYPTMPPRLLPGTQFTDSVAEAGFGSDHGGPIPADQYAAMPSLHAAWAIWVAVVLALVVRRRWPRLVVFAYPLVTTFAVMATANHYLFDVFAGAATIAFCAVVANRWGSGKGAMRPDRTAILAGHDSDETVEPDPQPDPAPSGRRT
jgi:membrane-associated phospholipid phosphatase